MMPHNLSEVIDGCIAFIDNRNITIEELMQHVKLLIFQPAVLFMEWKE
jgi:DNA gyrase/topoisomerase IV subunit A